MSTLNAIAVEAYKKYILVSLIHLGQVCFATIFYILLVIIFSQYSCDVSVGQQFVRSMCLFWGLSLHCRITFLFYIMYDIITDGLV